MNAGDPAPQAIVFDKDGTLFDFARTWEAWAVSFLRRLAPTAEAAARAGTAIGFDVTRRRFHPKSIVIAGTPAEVAAALAPQFANLDELAIVAVINEEAARAPQTETVPLAPFLARLRGQGLRLGVATNDAEAPARAHLRQCGVEMAFDFIAGFDSGHGSKPEPGQLLAFASAMNLAPERCVMVGDSLHDLRAGRAAGMHCVAVLTGMADAATLAPAADAVLPSIGALPDWLVRF